MKYFQVLALAVLCLVSSRTQAADLRDFNGRYLPLSTACSNTASIPALNAGLSRYFKMLELWITHNNVDTVVSGEDLRGEPRFFREGFFSWGYPSKQTVIAQPERLSVVSVWKAHPELANRSIELKKQVDGTFVALRKYHGTFSTHSTHPVRTERATVECRDVVKYMDPIYDGANL